MKDEELVTRFVATFGMLDDTILYDGCDQHPLATERTGELGFRYWAPRAMDTPRSALSDLYQHLPATFPPLYEELILSYRWAQVNLALMTLLANSVGPDLSGLHQEMFRDRILVDTLLAKGLLQFAKAGGGSYDPVCFDTQARRKDGDTPVVRVDHEEALCNRRLRITERIAPTLRALMEDVIAKAADSPPSPEPEHHQE